MKVSRPAEDICNYCFVFANCHRYLANHSTTETLTTMVTTEATTTESTNADKDDDDSDTTAAATTKRRPKLMNIIRAKIPPITFATFCVVVMFFHDTSP